MKKKTMEDLIKHVLSLPQTGTKAYGLPFVDDDRFVNIYEYKRIKERLAHLGVRVKESDYLKGLEFSHDGISYNVFLVPEKSHDAMQTTTSLLKMMVDSGIPKYIRWLKLKSNRYMLFRVVCAILEQIEDE